MLELDLPWVASLVVTRHVSFHVAVLLSELWKRLGVFLAYLRRLTV